MTETPQQYSQRLIKNIGDQDPLSVMESTMHRLEELSRKLEMKWQRKPSAEKWSAAQILAHLAEGEIIYGYRIRKALNSSGDPIEAYDQNTWVANSAYLQSDPQLAFTLFQALRKGNLARLRSLNKAEWERFGIHSERGKESILQMTRLAAGHDINHLRQIEEIAGQQA